MSRFSDMQKGTRAIKRVTCPVVNVSIDAKMDPTEAPSQFECGVRVLSVQEQEDVYEKALARTKRLGGEEGPESNLYNLSLQLYTIAAAYVDPDSDPGAAKLYFGDTIEQAAEAVLKSELLSRDSLAYLAEVQELWQDQCNPQTAPSKAEMLRCIEETAKNATFPLSLRPGARLTLQHTTAVLLMSLLNGKSTDSPPLSSEPEMKPRKPIAISRKITPKRKPRTSGRSGKKC
jgi:hypothetical protein